MQTLFFKKLGLTTMTEDNLLENLIHSLEKVCTALEIKAETELKEIENDCNKELASSVEVLHKFDELISNIGEACSELIERKDAVKFSKLQGEKNSIKLPYGIHSDVVKCVNEVYNMPRFIDDNGGKLINEKNDNYMSELIKICEKNVQDVDLMEKTIADYMKAIK